MKIQVGTLYENDKMKKWRRYFLNIGLIGCGAIGQFLLEKINVEKSLTNTKIVAVFDEREKSIEKMERLAEQYHFHFHRDLHSLLQAPVDLIIECANIHTVKKYSLAIIKEKSLLVISIGAMADKSFYQQLVATTKESKQKVYLPTGAIGGLDLLKAANSVGSLEEVKLISRKPAEALGNGELSSEKTLFKGIAKEAIEQFPKNANVAIALSLAGIGVDRTIVQMIADPLVNRNVHTIQLKGSFGEAEITIQNNPSVDNPKTSYLTGLSILSTIQSVDKQIIIG